MLKQPFLLIGLSLALLVSVSSCVRVSSYGDSAAILKTANAHEPHQYLQAHLNFSAQDLASMEQGEVVAKIFETGSVENEVGAFGIVKLNIPKELFVTQYRDIATFTKSPEVLAIAEFSDPPRLADIQGLTMDAKDIRDLQKCTPGRCKLKMDAVMMTRFQEEIDWSATDYQEQVNQLLRQMLFDYVTAYLHDGDAAMGAYHDQSVPLERAAAFHDMLQTSQYLMTYVPELYTYLHDFPHGHLANVESFIYWSKELYGLKPVLNLYHVIIYTRKRANAQTDVFIISKQIYANHYFESSFSFTAFVDEVGGDTSAAYLMYLNRSRFDQLRGQLKNMIVAVAKNNVYNGVKKYFRQVKERLEAEQVAVITPK